MKVWKISNKAEHFLIGTWVPCDDGDGSWVIQLHITNVDGSPTDQYILARPGDDRIYDFDTAGHSMVPNLFRVPPSGMKPTNGKGDISSSPFPKTPKACNRSFAPPTNCEKRLFDISPSNGGKRHDKTARSPHDRRRHRPQFRRLPWTK
jgi:hypothetical protein